MSDTGKGYPVVIRSMHKSQFSNHGDVKKFIHDILSSRQHDDRSQSRDGATCSQINSPSAQAEVKIHGIYFPVPSQLFPTRTTPCWRKTTASNDERILADQVAHLSLSDTKTTAPEYRDAVVHFSQKIDAVEFGCLCEDREDGYLVDYIPVQIFNKMTAEFDSPTVFALKEKGYETRIEKVMFHNSGVIFPDKESKKWIIEGYEWQIILAKNILRTIVGDSDEIAEKINLSSRESLKTTSSNWKECGIPFNYSTYSRQKASDLSQGRGADRSRDKVESNLSLRTERPKDKVGSNLSLRTERPKDKAESNISPRTERPRDKVELNLSPITRRPRDNVESKWSSPKTERLRDKMKSDLSTRLKYDKILKPNSDIILPGFGGKQESELVTSSGSYDSSPDWFREERLQEQDRSEEDYCDTLPINLNFWNFIKSRDSGFRKCIESLEHTQNVRVAVRLSTSEVQVSGEKDSVEKAMRKIREMYTGVEFNLEERPLGDLQGLLHIEELNYSYPEVLFTCTHDERIFVVGHGDQIQTCLGDLRQKASELSQGRAAERSKDKVESSPSPRTERPRNKVESNLSPGTERSRDKAESIRSARTERSRDEIESNQISAVKNFYEMEHEETNPRSSDATKLNKRQSLLAGKDVVSDTFFSHSALLDSQAYNFMTSFHHNELGKITKFCRIHDKVFGEIVEVSVEADNEDTAIESLDELTGLFQTIYMNVVTETLNYTQDVSKKLKEKLTEKAVSFVIVESEGNKVIMTYHKNDAQTVTDIQKSLPLRRDRKLAKSPTDSETMSGDSRKTFLPTAAPVTASGSLMSGRTLPFQASGFQLYGKTLLLVHICDITTLKVDAIVNAANRDLHHGGGIAAAISKAAGPKLNRECRELVSRYGQVPDSQVAETTAGDLPSKMVIHAVGPIWPKGHENQHHCLKVLKATFCNVLSKVKKKMITSLAMPAIGSGGRGIPHEKVVAMLCESLMSSLQSKTTLREIHIVDVNDAILKRLVEQLMTNDPRIVIPIGQADVSSIISSCFIALKPVGAGPAIQKEGISAVKPKSCTTVVGHESRSSGAQKRILKDASLSTSSRADSAYHDRRQMARSRVKSSSHQPHNKTSDSGSNGEVSGSTYRRRRGEDAGGNKGDNNSSDIPKQSVLYRGVGFPDTQMTCYASCVFAILQYLPLDNVRDSTTVMKILVHFDNASKLAYAKDGRDKSIHRIEYEKTLNEIMTNLEWHTEQRSIGSMNDAGEFLETCLMKVSNETQEEEFKTNFINKIQASKSCDNKVIKINETDASIIRVIRGSMCRSVSEMLKASLLIKEEEGTTYFTDIDPAKIVIIEIIDRVLPEANGPISPTKGLVMSDFRFSDNPSDPKVTHVLFAALVHASSHYVAYVQPDPSTSDCDEDKRTQTVVHLYRQASTEMEY